MSIDIHDKDFDLDEAAEYLLSEIESCSKAKKSNNDKVQADIGDDVI